MDKLREKDIVKLSGITSISIPDLTKLSAMGIFDMAASLDVLMLHDYKKLKQLKKYTVAQITQALMEEYGVSRTRVQSAIYRKKTLRHYQNLSLMMNKHSFLLRRRICSKKNTTKPIKIFIR